jgi:hypothetical protein
VEGATYTDFIPRNLPGWPDGPGAASEDRERKTDVAIMAAAAIDHLGLGRRQKAVMRGDGNGVAHVDAWDAVGPWEIASSG